MVEIFISVVLYVKYVLKHYPSFNTRRARKCVYLEGRSGSFDPHVELCAK